MLVESTYQHVDSLFHAIAYAPSTALKVCLLLLCDIESAHPSFACGFPDDDVGELFLSAGADTNTGVPISPEVVYYCAFVHRESAVHSRIWCDVDCEGVVGSNGSATGWDARRNARRNGKQGPKAIRVNILRAPPLNTLAARGIPHFLVWERNGSSL